MQKEDAIKMILVSIKNPICIMSLPTREKILKAAEEHKISASELVNYLYQKIQ